ncbi:MAG: hypothetical protein JWM85_2383 [Acidimicrobiaceae bacterium]|nr:hypothetical protein [Acidimicrobiaceae bacterium]
MAERTVPDQATEKADEAESFVAHVAGPGPDEAEGTAAEQARESLDDEALSSVGEHEREMNRIGAEVKGEGEIT